ncbi:MAG TPA: hypothetical protein DFS52_17105 [Myxococcales bacterium]|nr:hypothetical protein [Myxococcales bacterium]
MAAVQRSPRSCLLAFALVAAACAPEGCAVEAPSAPLVEEERVYGAVQMHLSPTGLHAGALELVPGLTSMMPSRLYVVVPASQVSIDGVDVALCENGCRLTAALGEPTVDRAPPSQALLTFPASVEGTLRLSGAVSCQLDLTASLSGIAEAAFGPDSVTHNLGARLRSITLPIQTSTLTLTPSGCPDGLDLGPVADALIAARAQLEQALLADARPGFEQAFCLPCETYSAGCPEGSTCEADGYCHDGAGECLFFPIGILGSADLAGELPIFHGPIRGELQVVAGQRESGEANPLIDANLGIVFRLYGGVEAVDALSPCVPSGLSALREPAGIDLAGEASRIEELSGGYHVAFALTEPFLTRLAESFYARGGLCLSVDRSLSPALTADSLITLLPSLELFAPRGAPALIDIRAKAPPRVSIGRGELATVDGKRVLVSPHATLVVDPLEISVYTVVEERLARLLAVEAEVSVPLGIDLVGAGQAQRLVPVLGSMADAVRNLRVTYNPILAESDETIVSVITALVGFAQLAFDGGMEGFGLEPVNGIGFEVLAARGVLQRPEGDHEALGIFLNFVAAPAP